jgi:hypothetical protein
MPRPRQRVCLQDGLKLDLNRLIRLGTVQPGMMTARPDQSSQQISKGGRFVKTRAHVGA